MTDNKQYAKELIHWYKAHNRRLPWREDRNPYRIWISEIMLQQTTTKAVVSYFKKFMNTFPNVKTLSKASLEEVYEQWAGLGYYSRARNVHASSKILSKIKFPKSYKELLELPGFGPYTARAVSSQAFGEQVGVVDGNVIRVYCRIFNFNKAWWNTSTHKQIQNWADQLSQLANPSDLNQALMELGATLCTPKSPACLLCPWSEHCQAFANQTQDSVPLSRPKKTKEIWIWTPEIYRNKKSEFMLVENNDVLFLSNKWVFPGPAIQVTTKPKKFTYKHNITHHEIYVLVQPKKSLPAGGFDKMIFVKQEDLSKKSPFSLMKKALAHLQ